MRTRTPIEKTIRYSTSVDELADAWAFVMEHLDAVGQSPSISIGPVWAGPDFDQQHFEVTVSGMVEA